MNNWDWQAEPARPDRILITGVEYRVGDRVRLQPKRRADIFDLALDGKPATIVSFEQDYENRVFITVTVDADPGKDFGMNSKPAHRFFFEPDEIELLSRNR